MKAQWFRIDHHQAEPMLVLVVDGRIASANTPFLRDKVGISWAVYLERTYHRTRLGEVMVTEIGEPLDGTRVPEHCGSAIVPRES